jgi:AAA+ ATPase superfamily predicted ATPase
MTSLLADPFSEAPKTSLENLYDRERESKALIEAVKMRSRMVLVLGVRRVGKTSLIKAALNSLGIPYIFLDLRALPSYDDKALYSMVAEELNRALPLRRRLFEQLRRVRGIRVGAEGISIDLGREKPSLISILRALNQWAMGEGFNLPIVFDEAQELRFFQGGRRGLDFRRLLAYGYDNLENMTFILSGSEVGVLYKLLGLEDPKSPLFGRYVERVVVERLDRDRSLDFLRAGFKAHNVKVEDDVLLQAVEQLDGIIGWLTYFGAEVVRRCRGGAWVDSSETIQSIRSKAVALCASELEGVARRSLLYMGILAELRGGLRTWSELKTSLEKRFKRTISNPQLANLLNTLAQLSLLEKDSRGYRALDPLVPEAAELLLRTHHR